MLKEVFLKKRIEKKEYIKSEFKNFLFIIKDIHIENYNKIMKECTQHGKTSVYKHCLKVGFLSYLLAKKLKMDYISIARGAFLHDFFLYDWHTTKTAKHWYILKDLHGFKHPETAKENAVKIFDVNEIEQDIIENHMFPLTFYRLPKHKEAVIVILVDKYCSTIETFKRF